MAWSPELAALGIELIEQPLHAERDRALEGLARPVPLCADESGHGIEDLDALAPLYDFINIKLDKTGGLTAALVLADAAEARGYGLMLGCMMATSRAMAPPSCSPAAPASSTSTRPCCSPAIASTRSPTTGR